MDQSELIDVEKELLGRIKSDNLYLIQHCNELGIPLVEGQRIRLNLLKERKLKPEEVFK